VEGSIPIQDLLNNSLCTKLLLSQCPSSKSVFQQNFTHVIGAQQLPVKICQTKNNKLSTIIWFKVHVTVTAR